jgi:3-hydroxyisobutyrate dehydrogenase/2-hydroxy-3-oxopropionate reductase
MSELKRNIGLIGAGAMGLHMIRHLIAAGHAVTASVRRDEAARAVEGVGARAVRSPAAAASNADVIITNVTSTPDVREVLLGDEGAIHSARTGAVVVDHSTIAVAGTREVAEALAARGIGFVDCPVSGGVRAAEAGTLTLMAGGSAEHLAAVRDVILCYGKTLTHVGPVGAGQVAKACNQIVQVVNIQGIAEAMLFCRAQGVDPQQMLTAISSGFAGSRMLELMGPKMVARDFAAGIESRLHAKDYGLILEMAQAAGLDLPAVQVTQALLADMQARGWAKEDTSALLKALELRQASA